MEHKRLLISIATIVIIVVIMTVIFLLSRKTESLSTTPILTNMNKCASPNKWASCFEYCGKHCAKCDIKEGDPCNIALAGMGTCIPEGCLEKCCNNKLKKPDQ